MAVGRMFRILIVDDERVEREGIRFLIEANHLCLETAEAENGRNALKYIESNRIDILFTDIKMPFMDGLELAEKAKKINPQIKIVIFSAFGEFDYARKAIENSVMSYVLKPIDISEFLELMDKLIRTCKDEYDQRRKEEEIFQGYLNDQEHQRSKMLYNLITEPVISEHFVLRIKDSGIAFKGSILLMLVNANEKLFDRQNDELDNEFKHLIQCNYEYLNIDEHQSLFFLHGFQVFPERDYLENLGQSIRRCISVSFGAECCVLFGNPVSGMEELSKAFSLIEQALDYRFYYDGEAVLFADNMKQTAVWGKIDDKLLSEIYNSIESKDFNYTSDMVEKLFISFKQNTGLSPVFVKYQCTNILRKLHEVSDLESVSDFTQQIEKVFENNGLMYLKKFMLDIVAAAALKGTNGGKESIKRVIRDVLEIIATEYMKDLNLEYIAQRVYMTPSYVSYLFKKEMGTTPIKYITQYRMEKARNLLLNTNMKIADVAEGLGYTSVSYFCMLFRNKFGTSPAGLREEGENR